MRASWTIPDRTYAVKMIMATAKRAWAPLRSKSETRDTPNRVDSRMQATAATAIIAASLARIRSPSPGSAGRNLLPLPAGNERGGDQVNVVVRVIGGHEQRIDILRSGGAGEEERRDRTVLPVV